MILLAADKGRCKLTSMITRIAMGVSRCTHSNTTEHTESQVKSGTGKRSAKARTLLCGRETGKLPELERLDASGEQKEVSTKINMGIVTEFCQDNDCVAFDGLSLGPECRKDSTIILWWI